MAKQAKMKQRKPRTPKLYSISFRMCATVKLTKGDALKVLKGDAAPIKEKMKLNEIEYGNGDSYIPGPWLQDDDNLPKYMREASDGNDVDLDI